MKILASILVCFALVVTESSCSGHKDSAGAVYGQDYVRTVPTTKAFTDLAVQQGVPGFGTLSAVKFLLEIASDDLYVFDSKKYSTHYDFLTKGLKLPINLSAFLDYVYGDEAKRRYLGGTIVKYDHLGSSKSFYAFEFYPSDTVSAAGMVKVYQKLKAAFPAGTDLALKAAGDQQEAAIAGATALFAAQGVKVVTNADIYKDLAFLVMNASAHPKTFGYLRFVPGPSATPKPTSTPTPTPTPTLTPTLTPTASDPTGTPLEQLTYRDIAIFEKLPLDVGVVSGIITEEFQTPLSHINLKSQARDTLNIVYPKAHAVAPFGAMINQLVSIQITDAGIVVEPAAQADAEAYWASIRKHLPPLVSDLNEYRIKASRELGFDDFRAYGAKAANYAEAANLNPFYTKPGYGIPFYYYNRFMTENGFWADVDALLQDYRTVGDRAALVANLEALQKKMKKTGSLPTGLVDVLTAQLNADYPGTSMRFRSSTNAEDLDGFSGAGLYDSGTYDPASPTKTIEKVLRADWASIWNLRAFDERDFYNIDHKSVFMGMLVSPAFPGEKANGVLVTKNIFNAGERAYYINTQIGEESVTNPQPGILSDESLSYFTVGEITPIHLVHDYIRHSNIAPSSPILSRAEQEELIQAAYAIDRLFRKHNGNEDWHFAIDIEFKINEEFDPRDGVVKRRLFIKQARPYVGPG